ncbi:hypothetical protein FNH22_19765 [Fulvivirga sp. M361]|uniref:hypothetical protein n=1 Tax=Fulvivirga sp. M361 TaxID=2594266 RepID=UPI001179C0CF|nr:hypothetical protein [Fulvivirga sp. M361]TRX54353.1 hypothetical protein FNH22_19765 [Fulvivirga sp. M361]
MRRLKGYSKLIIMLLISVIDFSCNDLDEVAVIEKIGDLEIIEVKLGNLTFSELRGTISQNLTLSSDRNWLLDGGIFVNEGVTLSIEPGTKIYAAFNEKTAFLSIQRGGRLLAEGTRSQPIVFTTIRKLTSIPQPGDWGGIILNGRAPINVAGGEIQGEGDTGLYGGTDTEDNSGILRYVIVEYAGKQLGEENELNSISLNGVGRSTVIEYVEALYGKDDGFEFFGGTVNARYIVSLGNGDDAFDWTYGWSGYGQFWVAQQDPFKGDRAIEADNNGGDINALPFSDPVLSNITLIGAKDADDENIGIKLRNGTRGHIYNAIVTNFSNHGIDVDEASAVFVNDKTLNVEHSIVFANAVGDVNARDFNNADAFLNDPSNLFNSEPVLEGFIGIAAGSFDPSTIDQWFTPVTFIGAVDPMDDWTALWLDTLR